jgi:hypothetical protein
MSCFRLPFTARSREQMKKCFSLLRHLIKQSQIKKIIFVIGRLEISSTFSVLAKLFYDFQHITAVQFYSKTNAKNI